MYLPSNFLFEVRRCSMMSVVPLNCHEHRQCANEGLFEVPRRLCTSFDVGAGL